MFKSLYCNSPNEYVSLKSLTIAIVSVCAFGFVSSSAFADYRLQPGDTLDFSVVGFPELGKKFVVDPDGDLTLPLAGTIRATQITLAELQNQVRELISSKVVKQRALDGRSISVTINADEVTLTVADYRPIYIQGAVSNGGEKLYRPGMTVRQAIAVAGGLDAVPLRQKVQNPAVELIRLQSEWQIANAEMIKARSNIARLTSDTSPPKIDEIRGLQKLASSSQALADLVRGDREQIAAQQSEDARQVEYLKTIIAQSDKRIELLLEQQKSEEAYSKTDAEDFKRIDDLYNRGNASVARLSDARRSMLVSSTRVLQTTAAIAQTTREREEYKRDLSNFDDLKIIKRNKDLQEAQVAFVGAQARIKAIQEQINYIKTQRVAAGDVEGGKFSVAIYRVAGGSTKKIDADVDTLLRPGDSIEVRLASEADANKLDVN